MDIKLSKQTPLEDGHYLIKFASWSGLHLVLVKAGSDGKKQIFCDASFKENKPLFFNDFPDAWWSELVNITV